MITGFFKNLIFQSKKSPVVYFSDAQLGLILSRLQNDMAEGLISCMITEKKTKTLLASFNSQETMISLFHDITNFLEHTFMASPFPNLANQYKICLAQDIVILVFLIKQIQISIIANSSLCNLSILEQITYPEIREILVEI